MTESRRRRANPRTPQKWRKGVFNGVLLAFLIVVAGIAFFIFSMMRIESEREVRTGVAEGMAIASSYKGAVVDYYLQHEQLPRGTAQEVAGELELPVFRPTANTKMITVLDGGVIQIEYTDKIVHGGKMLLLIPKVTDGEKLEWECVNGSGEAAFTNQKHLLPECRGNDRR